MKKIALCTLLLINVLNFCAAQTDAECHILRSKKIHNFLPLELQLKEAEAELAKAQYEQKKGPEAHNKDLVLPSIGMFLGGIWTIACTSKLFNNEFKTAEVGGCALGVVTFLFSYMKFNNSNPEGAAVLEQTVEAKKDIVMYLRNKLIEEQKTKEKK